MKVPEKKTVGSPIRKKPAQTGSDEGIRFKTLFEQSPFGVLLIDLEGNLLDFNEAAHRQLGYSREEFAKLRLSEVDAIQSPGEIQRSIADALAKGWAEFEVVHKTKQGEPRNVHVISQVLVLSGKTVFHTIWRDITDRKRAQDAVRRSEEKYRTLFDNTPLGAVIVDMDRRIVDCNVAFQKMLGYSLAELKTMTVPQISHADDDLATRGHYRAMINGDIDSFTMEKRHIRKDGRILWTNLTGTVIRDDQGKPQYLFGIVEDISERKKTKESLLLFRNLLNQSNDAIFVNDPAAGRFLIVNDKACGNLGYSSTELLAKRTMDIEATFPDQASWDAHVNEVKSRGYMIFEGKHKRQGGALFPVEVNVTYMTAGDRDYMVAVARDISERKLSEQALRLSEERLSKAQKMAHVGNWEWDLVTNQLYWSDEVYRIYGVDPATFVPTFDAVGKAMHTGDREPFANAVHAAIYERKHFEMDYRLIRPDGTERTVHTIGKVTYDSAGKPLIKSGTVQDITEQKQAEEKLRQSEEFARNILNTVDEGFIVIDRDFRIQTANKAYCSQAGRTSDEVVGRHCYEISHGALRPCYEENEECAVRRVFETGKPHTTLHRHRDAKGSILYVETKAFPIQVSSGTVTSVIETVTNITEKHLLEEERLKTQKLEAIGTLAGGIAHDFNNLLQGVFGYISMAKIKIDQKARSLAMLEQAEKALHMSVSLTKQLLTFSKGGKPVTRKMDVLPAVENAVKFALSGSSVDYRITADKGLRSVEADEGQVGQVIQNIVLNADQAMPLGGMIAITLKNVRAPRPGLPPALTKGDYVEIVVQDSGIGISEQYLQKIFDPYFTTKEKGSGLGLATSYSIIRNHGGVIAVASVVGKGTTFSVYLPAVEAKAKSVEAPAVPPSGRKGRILVMDDEELIRDIVGEMMRVAGHVAEFAEQGESAIAKYRAAKDSGNPFDIVILDLTIRGGLGGKETIKRLRELDPGVKAIVSSGFSEDSIVADHRTYGFAACLMKPYEFEELRDTLNALLSD
ncbi:MAG: PAS domain S-box protein [Nitrospiraceae bacterium]|nr:PAS domain S-box protein [Nitrospiraceae bacterium]